MPAIEKILSEKDFEALLAASNEAPVLIFKHSTQCPISAGAYSELEKFVASPAAGQGGLRVGLVRVIEERPVSQAIAARLGVQHESPQAILLRGGNVAWHDSHRAITAAALQRAVAGA